MVPYDVVWIICLHECALIVVVDVPENDCIIVVVGSADDESYLVGVLAGSNILNEVVVGTVDIDVNIQTIQL